jgi:ABC-2 type transport system permease protein
MLATIVRHEIRTLAADRSLWIFLAVLFALLSYAIANGAAWTAAQREAIALSVEEERTRYAEFRAAIARIDAGEEQPASAFTDPRLPGTIGRSLGRRHAVLPPAPLALSAIGQSDLLPHTVTISTTSTPGLPGREEIANPLHLLAGRLDLAFVVVFLLPLLVLALTFDMLAREREGGTLALLLSQPLRLRSVVFGKALARGLAVLVPTLAVTLAGFTLAGVDPAAAWTRVALWALAVTGYVVFWLALAVVVNLQGGGSARNAVVLASIWLFLAVLVPAGLSIGVQALHPVPSRAEFIGAEREAARLAQAEGSALLARYYEEHPELVPEGEVNLNDFAARSLAVQAQVRERLMPVRAEYDAQIDRQRRGIDVLRFLSPALLVQGALEDIAGTGEPRYRRYRDQVESLRIAFLEWFGPRVLRQARLAAEDADRIPGWQWEEEPAAAVVSRVGTSTTGILVPTLLLLAAAGALLRRYRIVG